MSTKYQSLFPMFPLGLTMATPGALEALADENYNEYLNRHVRGDWGDVVSRDWHLNNAALAEGQRIVSVYHNRKGVKLCVITEADRSATTIKLAEES